MTEEAPDPEFLEELRRRERESGSAVPPPPSGGEQEIDYAFGPNGVLISPMGVPAPEGYRKPVVTAFFVVIQEDGQIWANSNFGLLDQLSLRREAGTQDMVPACSQVISDIQMLSTVQNTVQAVMQTSKAMAEQQRNQAMAAKLQEKGIHLPRN